MDRQRISFFLFFLVTGACVVSSATAKDAAPAKGEVQGFSLEIPDEHGQTEATLEGTKAVFDPSGVIHISDVKAKIHQKDAGITVVTSPEAWYHRDSKVVTTDRMVKVDSKETHITGKGLVWEPEKTNIFIREKVVVVLKNVQKK